MSDKTAKVSENVAREGYPEIHEFDGAEYVRAEDYDSRLHASDVYFDSWKNTEAQFNQKELELDAACGEIALLNEQAEKYATEIAEVRQGLCIAEARAGILNDRLIAILDDYEETLKTGRQRILDLGGSCDSLEVMLSYNSSYAKARALTSRKPEGSNDAN